MLIVNTKPLTIAKRRRDEGRRWRVTGKKLVGEDTFAKTCTPAMAVEREREKKVVVVG